MPDWQPGEGAGAIAAERHGDAHAAFFRRLFDHVARSPWPIQLGPGSPPGLSGWYALGGSVTAVWTANAGGATGNARAYLYVYLPDIRRRVPADTFADLVAGLAAIPAYQAKIDEARANDFASKYPAVFVSDLLSRPEQVERLPAALDGLVDAPAVMTQRSGSLPGDRSSGADT